MYIILGVGTGGHYAASRLKDTGHQVTLVDIKPERTEALREMGFDNVVEGDITSVDLLKKINVELAKGVLILTTDLDLNIKAAQAIRDLSREVPIILRVGKHNTSEDFKRLEIDEIIYPTSAVTEFQKHISVYRILRAKLGNIADLWGR